MYSTSFYILERSRKTCFALVQARSYQIWHQKTCKIDVSIVDSMAITNAACQICQKSLCFMEIETEGIVVFKLEWKFTSLSVTLVQKSILSLWFRACCDCRKLETFSNTLLGPAFRRKQRCVLIALSAFVHHRRGQKHRIRLLSNAFTWRLKVWFFDESYFF